MPEKSQRGPLDKVRDLSRQLDSARRAQRKAFRELVDRKRATGRAGLGVAILLKSR